MTDEKKPTIEHLLAIRQRAALQIDPETAEVGWCHSHPREPYGDNRNFREEIKFFQRHYFARAPESDVWVWFGDLPDAVQDALWDEYADKMAFPAGLDVPDPFNEQEWLAIRKRAGFEIDPNTAEFRWGYAANGDPYGIGPFREDYLVGREYFAWAPRSGVWVWFGHLPKATADALWKRLGVDFSERAEDWEPPF